MKRNYLILVAGGKGLRVGGEVPKQFRLLNGRPVLAHTMEAFIAYDREIGIVLVLPDEHREYWADLCKRHGIDIPHRVVAGGATRFHSVKNGLEVIPDDAWVGVHDGVRPLVSREIISRTYETAREMQAAFPVIPLSDSIRKYTEFPLQSIPVNRSDYCLVQTPQVFRSNLLRVAYQCDYRDDFTDDVSVVEASGICRPVMVEGSRENLKITTPEDLLFAEILLKCRS